MKKSLLVLAALGAFAGAASAQSSVTVFGILDVGVRSVKNGSTDMKKLSTDGLSSSRLGFRGVEDLGGGLNASFWLEAQVKPDSGEANSTRFWHRRSTVSLSSASFGEVRLGRDLAPTFTAYSDNEPFGDNGLGAFDLTYSTLGSIDTKVRVDNMVSYFLPKELGGVYGQVSVSAGEGTAGKKYTGGRLGYKIGALDVTAAYSQTEVTTDDVKLTVVAGTYDFGVAKASLAYQQSKYQLAKETLYTAGVSVPVGVGLIRASYSKADGSGSIEQRDADHISLGYIHNLSKRTALYATYAQIKNKGTATFQLDSITGYTTKAGEKSQGYEFGIRHAF